MLFLYLETESRVYHTFNYQHRRVTVTHHICPIPDPLPVTIHDASVTGTSLGNMGLCPTT